MQGKVYLWKQVSSNIPNLVDSPLPSRLSISRRHPFYNVSHVVLLPTLSPRGTRNSDPEEANPRPHSFLPPPGFFPGLSARQLSCPSKMETPPSPSTEEIEFNSNFCTRWHFSRDCSPYFHVSRTFSRRRSICSPIYINAWAWPNREVEFSRRHHPVFHELIFLHALRVCFSI